MPAVASPTITASWPADATRLDEARSFLHSARGATVVIASDSDVDGLTGATIFERAVTACNGVPFVVLARRGEHVHRDSMRRRILTRRPGRLIVVDMGSRPEPILPAIPTLIVDHHEATRGYPPGAVVVNGFDRPPVAPSSVLAHVICRVCPAVRNTGWLAALGAVADLGSAASFRELLGVKGTGAKWTRTAALLNAARRAPIPDPCIALAALRQADSIDDILYSRSEEARALSLLHEQVRAETDRCARVPPAITGNVALLRFSSGAQVHPLIATRWSYRLRPRIVIAANDGYLPGRTNFAIRCAAETDLLAWMRGLPFSPSPGSEYANGHPRATGGSLTHEEFDRFLELLDFPKPEPVAVPAS